MNKLINGKQIIREAILWAVWALLCFLALRMLLHFGIYHELDLTRFQTVLSFLLAISLMKNFELIYEINQEKRKIKKQIKKFAKDNNMELKSTTIKKKKNGMIVDVHVKKKEKKK